MNQPNFADRLAALCVDEYAAAPDDHERIAAMIETLSSALGFAIALSVRGHPKGIDELMVGVERYIHLHAVEKSEAAQLINNGIREKHWRG